MLLSSNLTLCTTYIELCKNFGRRDRETDGNGCCHWTLIPPPSNLNCCVNLHELISVCYYAKTNLKPQNCTFIIYNFQGRILKGDAHIRHILMIRVIDSRNFRQFQERFSESQWDEDRKQNRKSNSSTDKKGGISAWWAWSLRIPYHRLGILMK